ncbi:MAG: hypothetical protein CBD02_02705 [Candidatus Pelagibacter sp. TMED142]|nr:MAG: hypothetical protein CBD02_02705 [Candidatus Pelagibacter sp. TMED142]
MKYNYILNKFRKHRSIIKNLIYFLIFALIIFELSKRSISISITSYFENFNFYYFFIAVFFFIINSVFGAYLFFLITKYLSSIKLSLMRTFNIIFNGQFLDFFPFFGTLYKAKRLKSEAKISYIPFLSIYLALLEIGLLNISFFLSLIYFFLLFYNQDIPINNLVFFAYFFFFLIFGIFFIKKIYFSLLNKKLIYSIFNKPYDLFKIITIFFNLQNDILKNKLNFLKLILLDFVCHINLFITFLFIFKCYSVELNIIHILIIYLLFIFITQVKIVPKNYIIDELIGAYLISLGINDFGFGLIIMITLRCISLLSSTFLFLLFNFLFRKETLMIKKRN